jgi:PAS domain S-box-containing protein
MFSTSHIPSNSSLNKTIESLIKFINSLDEGFELLELVFDKQGDVVDFVFLEVNPAYEKQTGLKAANLVGKCKKENAPAAEQRWYNYAIQAVKTGKTLSYQYYNDKVNGYFDTQFIPISTNRIAVLFKDITERKRIEAVLGESQKKYQDLTETTNDFVWEMDARGRYTYCSPQMEKLWGLKPSEMMGKTPFDVMPPGDRERALELFVKLGNSAEPFSGLQTTAYDSQGHLIYVETNGVPFFDAQGRLLGFRGISRDITERKKAEAALKSSEEKYRAYVENSPVAFFVATSEAKYEQVNDAACKLLGYSKEELLERTISDVLFKEDIQWGLKQFASLKETGKSVREFALKRKDGQPVFVILNATKLPDGKFMAFCENITERKKAEQSVLESEAKYRELVNLLPEMVFEIDTNENIVFANERALELTKYSKEDFKVGFNANHLVAPEDRARSKENIKKMFAGEMRQSSEYTFLGKDGARFPITLSSAPIIRNGKVTGLRGVAIDITERKKLEKQLQDQERLAAIGATAGMVGHDIRNPLQAITGDLFLIEQEIKTNRNCKSKDITESIAAINENISYINKIVSDLQDYTRPMKPTLNWIGLRSLITSALQGLIIPDEIRLEVDVKGDLTLKTDATFIKRIIGNLVSNAIQAMSQGGKLTIKAYEKKNRATITVEDTGVGIEEKDKPRLFKPLFTTKAKGQGLGLAVVKRLVEALNGTIGFESQVGKGTKFIIELPLTNFPT